MTLQLHMLDVGQGEAIVIDLPDGDFCLIDGGPSSTSNIVKNEVAKRVAAGRKFRFAAITHWDSDHIGGLPAVLAAYPPRDLVEPSIDLDQMERLCRHVEDLTPISTALNDVTRSLRRVRLGARQEVRDVCEGVEVWALSPAVTVDARIRSLVERGPTESQLRRLRNEASLVLWIRVYDTALLLPGEVSTDSAGEFGEAFGVGKGNIHHDDYRCLWLKLGHHGSVGSTDTELIRRFAHDSFVASASHGGRYGHPHPSVLDAVRSSNGTMMCNRLGQGCSLILRDPKRYPASFPSWTEDPAWRDAPRPTSHCYGTISVRVDPDGSCTVQGGAPIAHTCPYGGPASSRVSLNGRVDAPVPISIVGRPIAKPVEKRGRRKRS